MIEREVPMMVRSICSDGVPQVNELRSKYDKKFEAVSAGIRSGVYNIGSDPERRNFVSDVFELRIMASQLAALSNKPCDCFDLVLEDDRVAFVACTIE